MNANTLPPGLTNADQMARRAAALPRGVGQAHGLFATKAKNAEIWDVEGRRFIDFVAGIAVVNTGHCHPKVIAAAQAQIPQFSHTCFQVVAYDGYVTLAERLNKLAPGSAPKKTFFVSTGAEAVENAIKIARGFTGRPGVIAFNGGFHGRTLLALGLTGKVDPYKLGVGPFPAEIFHAPYPDEMHGVSVDDAIAGIEMLFKTDIEAKRVAAFIVEPVQGEGGYIPAPKEFFERLRALADQHGILIIADEIQTGAGRTGKMFAIEHSGVAPDLITMAKGLGGGFPIAAVIGRADVMDALPPGGLGSTYAGAPMACAAALAVLDVIEEEGLCRRATELGEHMQARLRELAAKQPAIGDVRGIGAMVAVEFFHGGDKKRPAADITKAVIAEAQKRGLLLLSCGSYGNVLRLMVPLTIEQNILDEGLDILAASVTAVTAQS
ncbi:MAG TPA: 4-aminobutyrate--2-oxoglutarate transaminase [Aromatoleum sp.]|uniref:4-aminobutyrate--2-oxoglutarate transaminase n=1 Tax=Aromatoleum sp. TaxID=2307007 RepID=UPI002B49A605|nr:4-aminobutyrate--2-oxoglutarate transaminase [Aromatoleum sp.]HJV27249.1 4-aminobutyrate--2-oxoglutarate transaminase [Aromatoleum sp.]